MDKGRLEAYQRKFRAELLENCAPFWMEHGWDQEHGGIYTYLARNGERCSALKSVWAQGRFLWTLCRLCAQYGVREEWMRAAESCKAFLDEHCIDKDGRMFFLVTGDGRPARKRRYFFSEAFYIMGFAEYALLTGDSEALQKARDMYDFVLKIYKDPAADPHQVYPKFEPETIETRALAGPMIMLNVSNILRRCDPANAARYDAGVKEYIADVTGYFLSEEHRCVFETVGRDGRLLLDIPVGRVVNPGHSIEAAWFLLNEARYFGDEVLTRKAVDILDWSLDLGWDRENGGLVYFVDRLGYPPEQYEHDMKLWWPQCEAVIAALMAYAATGEEQWAGWFERIADYAFRHFKDDGGPEWLGYLHKDNTRQLPIVKGNYFKGPLHLPRMLMTCDALIGELLAKG
jgi:N-acylglucosamine 2-epimerase